MTLHFKFSRFLYLIETFQIIASFINPTDMAQVEHIYWITVQTKLVVANFQHKLKNENIDQIYIFSYITIIDHNS